MRFDSVHSTTTTLGLVEHDLELWKKTMLDDPPATPLPLVVVDWSELFAYASAEPPYTREKRDTSSLGALHYAALSFLFYTLRCKLILLPPYAWELSNHLKSLRMKALSIGIESRALKNSHRQLVSELKKLRKDSKQFRRLLEGHALPEDSGLEKPTKDALRELLEKHVPSVFLEIQQRTLTFLEAINQLVTKNDYGQSQIVPLEEYNATLAKISQPEQEQVDFWYKLISRNRSQRDYSIPNFVDAVALGYMERLHQYLIWDHIPLFFASRSVHVTRVMNGYPGNFPCFIDDFLPGAHNGQSSARSWEYFAELGYYIRQNADSGSLRQRYCEADAISSEYLLGEVDEGLLEWCNARGTFDLGGLGNLGNWRQLEGSKDYWEILIKTLRAVLSEQFTMLVEEKEQIAEEILGHTITIFRRLGIEKNEREVTTLLNATMRTAVTSRSLLESLLIVSNVSGTLQTTFGTEIETRLSHVLELLRYPNEENGRLAHDDAYRKLTWATEQIKEQPDDDKYVWVIAFYLFVLGESRKAYKYLKVWLGTTTTTTKRTTPTDFDLLILTRVVMAECLKSTSKHDNRSIQTIEALLEDPEPLDAYRILSCRMIIVAIVSDFNRSSLL